MGWGAGTPTTAQAVIGECGFDFDEADEFVLGGGAGGGLLQHGRSKDFLMKADPGSMLLQTHCPW